MEPKYKYEKLNWYPHMGPEDALIWGRCIEAHPALFTECEYDVKVGTPPPFDTTVNQETGGHVTDLYKRKIDVVGYENGTTAVVEVKKDAGFSSIGQVKGYVHLFKISFPDAPNVFPLIVTNKIDADAAEFAKKEGVIVLVV